MEKQIRKQSYPKPPAGDEVRQVEKTGFDVSQFEVFESCVGVNCRTPKAWGSSRGESGEHDLSPFEVFARRVQSVSVSVSTICRTSRYSRGACRVCVCDWAVALRGIREARVKMKETIVRWEFGKRVWKWLNSCAACAARRKKLNMSTDKKSKKSKKSK